MSGSDLQRIKPTTESLSEERGMSKVLATALA
jgi:hypothetical protein